MKLQLYIVKHSHFRPDEAVWLPICDGCGQRIDDFEEANLVLSGEGEIVKAAPLDQYSTQHHQGEAKVYHFDCEPDPQEYPWFRLSSILKTDQRSAFDLAAAK